MNKAQLQPMWDHLKDLLVNVRKQMDLVPAGKLGYQPTPEVRTMSDLCIHLHEYLTEIPDTVKTGKQVTMAVPTFSDKQKLLAWCDNQVKQGFATFDALTDAQLAANIAAFGQTFPGWQLLTFINEEVLHHRGQLTVYLRLIGIPPILIYNFAD
jgi:uncharacterized damage-inducible protein DinB